MHATQEVIGDEVIGFPGQNLTANELLVLVGLANGNSPSQIGAGINADPLAMRHIESSIKSKLGAKTHPHMISRGFTLGVLIPRALCIMLSMMCAAEQTDDGNRNQTRRGGRNTPASRLARSSAGRAANDPSDHHGGARIAQCFQLCGVSHLFS